MRTAAMLLVLAACGSAIAQHAPATQSTPTTRPAADSIIYRDDFEQGTPLMQRWEARGSIQAARQAVDENVSLAGVSGRVLSIRTESGARIGTKPLLGSLDLQRCGRVIIRINALSASPSDPEVLELRFNESDRQAWWWRKIKIEQPGWREVVLPLPGFRQSRGAAPRWEHVDRLGLHFRTKARLLVDGIELVAGDRPDAAYASTDQIRDLAFGDAARVRTIERSPFTILTDSPALDGQALLDALHEMYASLKQDLPSLPAPTRPVYLLIFAADADYRAFWPRLAERLGGTLVPPASDGFTSAGIASSACRPEACELRPVFVHEAAHALLEQVLGLACAGGWLHEGLAARYQLQYSKQDISPLVRAALDDPGQRTPLAELLDGGVISSRRYWQAATVVDWLLADPDRRQRFSAAIEDMGKRVSTNMRQFARRHFEASIKQLEARWLDWVADRYGE